MNPNVKAKLIAPGGLATRLRGLRRAAGLSGVRLAAGQGWQQSKVSRIETGEQMPSSDDVRAWAAECGAADEVDQLLDLRDDAETEQVTWRRRGRRGLASIQAEFNEVVQRSKVIRHFETAVVPGLLQTWNYAYWVGKDAIRLHGDPTGGGPEAIAQEKLKRSEHLQNMAKRFEFLLAEPVLRWLPCPPEVMLGQLDRLLSVSMLPNVRMGVIPLGAQIDTAVQNSFVLYDDVARVETFVAEDEYRGETAVTYSRVLAMLWHEAVEGDEARRLIIRAGDDLRKR